MKYKINLLQQKKPSFVERLMHFFLNYLRYIIVVTQLIVIGVFFFRFRIDQNVIDLKESVDQKKEIIQVVMPLLKQAEEIDRRSKEAKKILKAQDKFDDMLSYLLSKFPKDLTLESLEIGPDSLKMKGKASNSRILQAFYLNLKEEKKFNSVDLQNIKKTDFGYGFDLVLSGFAEKQ